MDGLLLTCAGKLGGISDPAGQNQASSSRWRVGYDLMLLVTGCFSILTECMRYGDAETVYVSVADE